MNTYPVEVQYNEDEQLLAITLNDGRTYLFEVEGTGEGIQDVVDTFLDNPKSSPEKYSPEEDVVDLSGYEDITHVYLHLDIRWQVLNGGYHNA